MTNARTFLAGLLCLLLIAGCQIANDGDEGERVSQSLPTGDESSPTADGQTVHLPDERQQVIGLSTAIVKTRRFQTTLPVTGWIESIPGNHIVVKSPATGFYVPVSESRVPQVGSTLKRDDNLGAMKVLLLPQEAAQLALAKEDADTQIEQAKASLDIAERQLERVKNEAGTVVAGTRIQELEEKVERARAAHQQALEKLPFLPKEPYTDPESFKDVPVVASLSGKVIDVHVTPRQLVIQGDPLWTVADWGKLWLRIPLFERDFERIARNEPADVRLPDIEESYSATPTHVSQPVEPGTRTLDLYYHLTNVSGDLRPGQALSVALPLGQSTEQILLPKSAIIWDSFGNAWVYAKQNAESFRRVRVETGVSNGEDIVIERGLKDGEEIVIVGAESLYSEEFRGQLRIEDDD